MPDLSVFPSDQFLIVSIQATDPKATQHKSCATFEQYHTSKRHPK